MISDVKIPPVWSWTIWGGGSKIQYISEPQLGLIKAQLLGPNLQVSDSVGLGRGLRICISNHFPMMSMLLAQGRHTWKTTTSFPLLG